MRSLHPSTVGKLFVTGFTVGPIVDSLHNQCLLKYDMLPLSIEWPSSISESSVLPPFLLEYTQQYPYLFCSSWTVPPLLGLAYVVLGALLPRLCETIHFGDESFLSPRWKVLDPRDVSNINGYDTQPAISMLRNNALLAVTTTALIIKLSEFLETHQLPTLTGEPTGVLWLLAAALTQWAILDGSIAALLAATITSIGGPLSELPFVAHGVWEYLDSSADYQPLQSLPLGNPILEWVLGKNYPELALSSITGPCYFAVAMDAIALGRWFDATKAGDVADSQERSS
ncbi:hypothetical protein IV203_031614 [Nitzschia inconspicua]|uniref:Uncharacterized protein n=1 Tax=Nitzschia inconspicua TaxID=303405 RepID=A0A9K3K523_9STRA|nr:hypothetical protein IV203_011165 [Nitzschia inconspicua]KAG7368871.1 hypothetical protein IV203_031614 [Nitzschia inconspicua]